MVAWSGFIVPVLYPPKHIPPATNQIAAATNGLAAETNPSPAVKSPVSVETPRVGPLFVSTTNTPEQTLVVGNENARYIFTSRGGGLKDVQLLHYPATANANHGNHTGELTSLGANPGPPVFALLGDPQLQGDGVFKLSESNSIVRAEKTLTNGLRLTKEFQLSSNYLVTVSTRIENTSTQAVMVPAHAWMIGTATPMGPQDNGLAETVLWYNGGKTEGTSLSYFNTNTSMIFGFFPRTPKFEYLAGVNNVAWAAAQNQYFALAAMPAKPAAAIAVHAVDLPPPSEAEVRADSRTVIAPRGLETSLLYPGEILAPGKSIETKFNLFAGPKEYRTLTAISVRFNNDLDQIMSFGFFGPVSKALLVTMDWLHESIGLKFGWIIILITVVIRLTFWPLTRASTRSMKRMQALQPQLKALQEKYKDKPQEFSRKQWEFYKKNKVNPLGGCLPMLLQIPVFFGFFGMLRNAIELRGDTFLWIHDLSQPDTVLFLPFPGYSFPLNIMPLIMGASQFWQASLTPPSPGMDPAQQKMMRYMPLMMMVFLYNYSSGLALYWTVSNLLGVLQTKLTKMEPVPANGIVKPVPAPPQKKRIN